MLGRRKLPIGIQTFAKIRNEGYYYVDKTPLVAALAEGGGAYFLSRPRRFGKSLFLDTVAEAFAGNRLLFEGGARAERLGADPQAAARPRLYLADHWDWGKRHPIVRVSFAEGRLERRAQLEEHIHAVLEENAERLAVPISDRASDVHIRFQQLISRVAERYGERVVVLIDEYDKPILDNLTEPQVARAMREGLRNFYSVLKGRDADLRFVLLTGVSKFSKVSLFSELNHLRDITLSRAFATICGYTEYDLDSVFQPEFAAAAEAGVPLERETVRRWYNGYAWEGEPVYNPFDILLLFAERVFRRWWFETGTSSYLVDWLRSRGYFTPALEQTFATEQLLSAFDVDHIEPEAMLWQSGYLTIEAAIPSHRGVVYRLRLPNQEVRSALNEALLTVWAPPQVNALANAATFAVYDILAKGDATALRDHFERLFAAIPHDWYRKNPIAQYEGYFASVCYSHLASLGVTIVAEDVTNQGRTDLTVQHGGTVWVFEFKVGEGQGAQEALAQLRARDYAAKYRNAPGVNQVVEVGVAFSPRTKRIAGWEVNRIAVNSAG
ncbi:ATP-binding protein [Hydrogenophilus thiooxidans]|uniref:ATP-binding protein n=1 Tax=Hydrogenophilus thiooxidans TaxID=2820326 RepID=UPI001C23DCBF|nr:ATP-binding protein [Hydrogenophilus thiooxidans]